MAKRSRLYLTLLLGCLLLFLALTLYQINLPGPNYDEAVEAKPAIELLTGQPVEAHRGALQPLFGLDLPLMVVDYVGALNTYALLLFFKIGGVSVATMRLWPILVGASILLLTFGFGRVWLGGRAALLAAFLLAIQPSHVFFSRQGIYVTNTTIAFSLGILLALWRLAQTGRLRWWLLAAFLAGLGLWAKFIMLWPLVAIALLTPAAWAMRQRLGITPAVGFSPRLLLRPRWLLSALLAFGFGLLPFLIFNIQTGATFSHFLGALGQSYYGVENADYLTNLLRRVQQLGDYLQGDHFWYLGGNFTDRLAPLAWLTGLGIGVVALLWRRLSAWRLWAWRALFVYAFTGLLLLQSPLTPTDLWYTHLAIFSPFLALGAAGGWNVLFRSLPRRWANLAAAGLALALAISSLAVDVNYHRALAISGGYADHSDATYRLGETLLAHNMLTPYALDWGFEAPIILVTAGRVNPIEVFGYEPVDRPDDDFAARIRPLLHDPETVFLIHPPDRTNFQGRREALDALAASEGVELEIVDVVYDRSGVLHTVIVRPRG
ncbi:MAG: glycosyltransferase family 39 protein [Caldilineales bacterium]|nr:glycosyltransferase family 39 protein [Caldilineales bacterium]